MHFQEHKVKKINHSPETAWLSIQRWCAYQERSQHETRLKLLSYGIRAEEAEELIARLISENFLNEERFALAFASGKFRIKRWGRNKIRSELRKHHLTERTIRTALDSIAEADYFATLGALIDKKLPSTGADRRRAYYTVLRYLVGRGFESDLAGDCINQKIETQRNESRS